MNSFFYIIISIIVLPFSILAQSVSDVYDKYTSVGNLGLTITNFGIIGNPIKHSLSPVLHNYWFQKYKIDANYSTIEISDNELSEIVRKIKDRTLSGVNITLPYKQKITPLIGSFPFFIISISS